MARSGRIALAVLLVLIAASGVEVVENAERMRDLYRRAGEVQRDTDEHLAQFSRLQLEIGALTSLPNIERVARDELGMTFPAEVERLAD